MTDAVLLCCDEGPGIGLGHRARCEAIAAALRTRGLTAAVMPLTGGIVAAPVIVVDSYRLRADDRHHFVPDVVVAVDDLERDMAVDCIVAPSPGARADAYRQATQVLAGARFALLPTSPGAVATSDAASGGGELGAAQGPARILVTTGATDHEGIGARIAASVHERRPDAHVELVVGAWGCDLVPDGVTAIRGARSLTPMLVSADVVVTAGGVTLLEALHLGRPCVAFATAGNQRANLDAVGAAGAAVVTDVAGAAGAACALLDDHDRGAALSDNGRALIDGRGADRVADVIVSLAVKRALHEPRTIETVGSAP